MRGGFPLMKGGKCVAFPRRSIEGYWAIKSGSPAAEAKAKLCWLFISGTVEHRQLFESSTWLYGAFTGASSAFVSNFEKSFLCQNHCYDDANNDNNNWHQLPILKQKRSCILKVGLSCMTTTLVTFRSIFRKPRKSCWICYYTFYLASTVVAAFKGFPDICNYKRLFFDCVTFARAFA